VLLCELNITSYSLANVSHIHNSFLTENEVGANKITSSVYPKDPQYILPTYQPTPHEDNFLKSSSMYIINKIGDNTPPCFTPLVTGTWFEIKLPHFTLIY